MSRATVITASILLASSIAGQPSRQSPSPPLANAVILVIRHAEKPEDGNGLTLIGQKRAEAYIRYFKDYRLGNQPLRLDHLFAAADSAGSHRPRLTIEPLARALRTNIDLRFTDKAPEAIAQDLRIHRYGSQLLVCRRHGKIPELLRALGADPQMYVPEGKWPGQVYDRVIELHFDSQGKIDTHSSRLVLEHLMPGDETQAPNASHR